MCTPRSRWISSGAGQTQGTDTGHGRWCRGKEGEVADPDVAVGLPVVVDASEVHLDGPAMVSTSLAAPHHRPWRSLRAARTSTTQAAMASALVSRCSYAACESPSPPKVGITVRPASMYFAMVVLLYCCSAKHAMRCDETRRDGMMTSSPAGRRCRLGRS